MSLGGAEKANEATMGVEASQARKERWMVPLSFFACAVMLGVGLAVGGMTDPRRANAFFNAFNFGTKYWDPSLAIVFASALAAHSVVYHLVRPMLSKPVFAPEFSIPCKKEIDHHLILGSVMFGAGWAFTGYCPGPGLVAMFAMDSKTLLFIMAMFVGMFSCKALQSRVAAHFPGAVSAMVAMAAATLSVVALLAQAYQHPHPTNAALEQTLDFTLWRPLVGGALIGTAIGLSMVLLGEVLGISGIVSGIFSPLVELNSKLNRLSFLGGLLFAGALVAQVAPDAVANHMHRSDLFYLAGGALVGFGTCLGGGCTSGHGIAGLTRLSPRSIIAVACFFATNILLSSLLYTLQVGTGWQSALN